MSRPVLLLFLSLAAALGGFGLLADHALVREAAGAAELASARTEQDTRTAALSVRGALGQIEQNVLAGRRPAGVRPETLALPPALSVASGRSYRALPRAQLVALLLSTEATPWGLPEAVVAAVALGAPASRREVTERLLTGQLPVHPEDLPELARLLDAGRDPRVAELQQRLRSVPDRGELPDIARDIPTTDEDIAVLRALRLGNPGENLLPLLIRLQRSLPAPPPSRKTSEGWEPFTL